MTHPGELELATRKRLNEAMRRRFESPAGLVLASKTQYFMKMPCFLVDMLSPLSCRTEAGPRPEVAQHVVPVGEAACLGCLRSFAQVLNAAGAVVRFSFLQSFIADKDMADIHVESFYEEQLF